MKFRNLYLPAAILLALGMLFGAPLPFARTFRGLVRDGMAPYHSLTASLAERARQLIERRRQRRDEAGKWAEEKSELRMLRRDLLELGALRDENDALRRQLNYVSRSSVDLVACRVIARGELTGWWRTLRINRGAADGLRTQMPVVSEYGLVGRIEQTSRHTAEVLLISDASSRVSVSVQPSRTPGILEGASPRLGRRDLPELLFPVSTLDIEFLSLHDAIQVGHDVVTSGLGGIFPPGIRVGVITGISEDPSGLYRRAQIMPAVDFHRLDTLYVVRAMEGKLP